MPPHTQARAQLPSYAVPAFVRLLPAMEQTGTFKQNKVGLRAEGIDPGRVADPLFWLNPKSRRYEPFGREAHAQLVQGTSRL